MVTLEYIGVVVYIMVVVVAAAVRFQILIIFRTDGVVLSGDFHFKMSYSEGEVSTFVFLWEWGGEMVNIPNLMLKLKGTQPPRISNCI